MLVTAKPVYRKTASMALSLAGAIIFAGISVLMIKFSLKGHCPIKKR
jgi:hypothetical protein